ncbi:hypothetical protein MGYG_01057 [Nannizzia gypsea CBS 118893]|uniref:Uncharacterized protein n=1 Tax=Arthroderma gypseum (strain ATCC MYA-4604 / CBS 118893) TaxID=535722 RepID=E5QYE4_ARTGP|nr:hypothetical protein MGYG_01057 [Nannizzia gypsea CBS 118893]EFQ98020.1 hypothetical protein MGYG_01057 [Nannizzia gypsea CBS 118893]
MRVYGTGNTGHKGPMSQLRAHSERQFKGEKKALASAYPWIGGTVRGHALAYILRIPIHIDAGSSGQRDSPDLLPLRLLIPSYERHSTPALRSRAIFEMNIEDFETSPQAPLDGGDKATPSNSPGKKAKGSGSDFPSIPRGSFSTSASKSPSQHGKNQQQ